MVSMTSSGLIGMWNEIAAAYQTGGLGALNKPQLRELAVIFVQEVRKGAFDTQAEPAQVILPRFMGHFTREFAEDPNVALAWNYQKQLLAGARRTRAETHPVESIILYATWAEHWVNAVLLARALARGLAEEDTVRMLRDAQWPAKLGWLWRTFGLVELEAQHRGRLQHLIDTRNEYVHYKWKGKKLVEDGMDEPLTGAIRDIEPTIAYLVDYQLKEISGPALREAAKLFGVDLRRELRASYEPTADVGIEPWPALGWNEPLLPPGAA
jgi:hypothetical protein